MNLTLDSVTGFESRDKTIRVTAPDGRTLYYFNNPKRKRVTFNLPSGEWETNSRLERLKRPLKYRTLKLPPHTRHGKIVPLHYEVGDNPNKCSIETSTGHVLIDEALARKDIPFLTFVLFHENAHFHYAGGTLRGESLCDCWSAKQMLRRGYNPSQINYAQEYCLKERGVSRRRKDILYKWLKKVKVYE